MELSEQLNAIVDKIMREGVHSVGLHTMTGMIHKVAQLESSLAEARDDYHLAHAKISSREAIIKQLSETELAKDVTRLEAENKKLREFVRLTQVEWTVLESVESDGVVRVEYPCAVHIKMKELIEETINLPTNG